ncbi:MAG: metallophosphoesterase [Pseudomonadota bacterium]|nr:metallophosphoesterase [Pseudomonadota bacterium]MEE2864526.1 metallophosphoesterase [Pseudomonadota bacterium]
MFDRLAIAFATLAAASLPLTGAQAQSTEPVFYPGTNEGLFLIVTDIHFDPFSDPALVPALDKSPVSGWTAIFKGAAESINSYGNDASYSLMVSALDAAAAQGMTYDYVLYTGDYLSHHFNDTYQKTAGDNPQGVTSFAIKTAQYVSQLLGDTFGDIPVYGVLGNEDSACGDYQLAPDSAFLEGVGEQWAKLSRQPGGFQAFKHDGFYKVTHPTVPDQDIIALSNVYWAKHYSDACNTNGGDPGKDVMAWLDEQLAETQQAGRKAQLLMHVPPGADARDTARHADKETCEASIHLFWHEHYLTDFLELMYKYAGTVDYTFSGHTHMDGFTVINDASGEPLIANQITASVSPVFGNNPAFAVFLYDKTSGAVKDSATFYLTNLEAAAAGAKPDWQLEYDYRSTYAVPDLSAASRASLAKTLQNDEPLRQRFSDLYAVQSATPEIDPVNWQAYGCALDATSLDAYKTCLCSSN